MKSDKEKTRKTSLKSVTPGERLKLRDNVYEYMQTREWIFGRVERDETILLVHESEGFGWHVKMGYIDWGGVSKI